MTVMDPAGEEVVERPCSCCPAQPVIVIDARRPDQADRRYRACATHVRPLVDELIAQGWSTSTVDLDHWGQP